MLTSKALLLFFGLCALPLAAQYQAPLWPEALGEYHKAAGAPAKVQDRDVLEEYGLQQAEDALFQGPGNTALKGTSYRFRDAIGGYAGYLWLRPRDARPADLPDMAVEAGEITVILFGNYVLRFEGGLPEYTVFEELLVFLPSLDRTPYPTLSETLPPGRIPNSERMVLGPVSLTRLLQGVGPATAAFRLGAQGMTAEYPRDGGPVRLAAFSYPSPGASRCTEFQKLPGAQVRCEGSLVVLALAAPTDVADRLLSAVQPLRPTPSPTIPPRTGLAVELIYLAVLAGLLATSLGLFLWLRRRLSGDSSGPVRLHQG